MSFRDTLLEKCNALGLDEDALAEQLVEVIKGQKREEVYEVSGGTEVLKKVKITKDPEAQLRGLIIADTLQGGSLGLAPKDRRLLKRNSGEIVHKRITQDNRVIVNPPGVIKKDG